MRSKIIDDTMYFINNSIKNVKRRTEENTCGTNLDWKEKHKVKLKIKCFVAGRQI